jgi:glycerophosphoryl diester phosphodiesterase
MLIVAHPLAAAPPLVIAHRGASAERPEHTLAAYARAIAAGADYIEPDLVPTRDGYLVARHENEISGTTDVASHPEFDGRRATKRIDGVDVSGWFTEDFTLAELRTLRARERLPGLRPANVAYNGQFPVPTFDEILDLVAAESNARGRSIGVYPETKHPSYFRSIGLPLEDRLLTALARHGLSGRDAPVFIQSFEVGNLRELRKKTAIRLVQLMAAEGGPADLPGTTYAAMATPAGLTEIATYADAIGAEKTMVIPRDAAGRSTAPTTLVADAHRAGLLVHVWTLRPENAFLPRELQNGTAPAARGDIIGEIRAFTAAGVDGFFTDSPADGVAAARASGGLGGQP